MSESNFSQNPAPLNHLGASQNSGGCGLPCLIVSGVFVLIFIAGFVALFNLMVPKLDVITAEEAVRNRDLKYEAAKTAFTGDYIQDNGDEEFRQIQNFLGKLSNAADFSINPKLEKLVDYDRYAVEIRKDPHLGPIAYMGNTLVSTFLRNQIIGPTPFADYQIYKIEDLGNDERLVYLQISGEYGDDMPFMYWIKRRENGWRIYDWEHVRYGIRETAETAVIFGDTESRTSDDYDTYISLYESYNEETDRFAIRKILNRSKNLKLHKRLQAPYWYDIAHRYWYNNDYKEAMELLERIQDPKEVPGKWYLMGMILNQFEKYEESAEAFKKYQDLVGYDSETLDYMTGNFRALKRAEEEMEAQWLILRDASNESTYSSALDRLVAKQRLKALKRIFADERLRVSINGPLAGLASGFRNEPIFEQELESIVAYFKKEDSGAEQFHNAAGDLDFLNGRFDEGLAHFTEAASINDDRSTLLSRAGEVGRLQDVVANSTDLLGDMKILWDSYQYDGNTSYAQMKSVVEAALAKDLDSLLIKYWSGCLAYYDNEFEDSIAKLSAVLADPRLDGELEEYDIDQCKWLLLDANFEAGMVDEAFKLARKDDESTLRLVGLLLDNGQWQDARIQTMMNRVAKSAEKKSVQGRLLQAQGKDLEARLAFVAAVNESIEEDAGTWGVRAKARQLVEAFRKTEDFVAAFELCPRPEVLESMAEQLQTDGDLRNTTKLIAIAEDYCKQNIGRVPAQQLAELKSRIASLKITMDWTQENYQAVLDSIDNYVNETEAAENEIEEEILGWAVRSAFRTNQLELAEKLVDGKCDQYEWKLACALIALKKKNFEEYQKIKSYLYRENANLHLDSDEFEFDKSELQLAKGEMQDLTDFATYPNTRIGIGSVSAPKLDTGEFARWSEDRGLKVMDWSSVEQGANENSWVFFGKGLKMTVQIIESSWETENLPDEIKDEVKRQKYVMEIESYSRYYNRAKEQAYQLAVAIAPDDAVVLDIDNRTGLWSRCQDDFKRLAMDEIYRSELRAKLDLGLRVQSSNEEDQVDDDWNFEQAEEHTLNRLEFGRAARRFVDAKAVSVDDNSNGEDLKLRVYCELDLGGITESLPVDIDKVVCDYTYSVEYQGTLGKTATLYNGLEKGDRVSFRYYMIKRWELLDQNGKVVKKGE